MTFNEALATQPAWIQYWVMFMGLVTAATIITLLFSPPTRRIAVVLIVTMLATFATMLWAHSQVGFVRLLGLVHVVFWTPLAIYLWRRVTSDPIASQCRQMIWLLLAVMVVSLEFDYADVVRYLLGERASLVVSGAT
jgi:hypothetical protein